MILPLATASARPQAMKTALAILLTFLAITNAVPLPCPHFTTRQTDLATITDRLLFSVSIDDFQAARAAQDPPELDWSSDGCTDSPEKPLVYDFHPSCQRHDFGYRNYKAQNRFSDPNKAKIDSNFKKDMYNECAKDDGIDEDVCKRVADVYYEAVVVFGKKRSAREQAS